jgi:hypothetical protein
MALVHPLYDFYNQVPQRRAMVDWYNTEDGNMIGFTARSVVGGVFIPFLYDLPLWHKWASRDQANPKTHIWAPQPVPPQTGTLIAAADKNPSLWRYTTAQPAEGWEQPAFDDSKWTEGKSGFGSKGTPGAVINTEWTTGDLWLRREITLPAGIAGDPVLRVIHDEDCEIYFNGIPALRELEYNTSYESFDILPAAKALLKPGARIVMAIHCHQTRGGQSIDAGLDYIKETAASAK